MSLQGTPDRRGSTLVPTRGRVARGSR